MPATNAEKSGYARRKKSPVLRLVCAAPLDLTKIRVLRVEIYEIIRNEKFRYFATAPYVIIGIKALFITCFI